MAPTIHMIAPHVAQRRARYWSRLAVKSKAIAPMIETGMRSRVPKTST